MQKLALIAVLTAAIASPAVALEPIQKNPTVIRGFYAIGLADEVR